MRNLPSILLLLFILYGANAQQPFEVAIISDASENESHFFEASIKAEIKALLASRFELSFTEVYTSGDVTSIMNEIADVYTKNQADVLIGAGIVSSKLLANQNSFLIPSIASIQLMNDRSTDPVQTGTISNISNFTYIISPFNIEAGINTLKGICRCEKLAVLTNSNLSSIGLSGEDIYSDIETEIEWLSLERDLSSTLNKIPADAGGVYVLSPLSIYSSDQIKLFFDQLIERKLPSFTLLDSPMLEQGAYASFATSDNLQKIPRRIAMNVEKIAEGKNPKDFSVNMENLYQSVGRQYGNG